MSVEYARQYRKVRKEGGPARRRRVWGSMVYRCRGVRQDPGETLKKMEAAGSKEGAAKVLEGEGCGFERRVYLGIGCEGPPALKEAGLFLPVPMYAGVCENCGGGLMHVRWGEDEEFAEKDAPPDAALFIVPGKSTAARFAESGFAGAELIRTEAEKVALRKFHGPRPPER